MSAQPMDVLAVMDAIDGWVREVSDEFIDGSDFRVEYARDLRDFREARAAVAELIEAAKLALDGLNVAAEQESEAFLGFVFAGDRLRTALARVQGGQS